MSEPERERRQEPRVAKINLVQVNRFNEDGLRADLATGRTINLSRGGLRLELHHPIPLRSKVTLNLVIGEQILDLAGSIVYLEALDESRCCMGIQFEDVDPETQKSLDDYVAASEAAKAH